MEKYSNLYDPDTVLETNEFKKRLFERLNGISSKFKINYSINPKISYEYPKINPIICQNIINSLIKYPKFYIQTLHLMNKMNLPCPLLPYVREPCQASFNFNQTQIQTDKLSSSESEIETDTELHESNKRVKLDTTNEDIHPKRLRVKSLLKSIKFNENNQNFQNNTQKQFDLNQVFESITTNQEDRLLKEKKEKNQNLIYDRTVIQSNDNQSFSKILPINQKLDEISRNLENNDHELNLNETDEFIKKEDLEKNRLKLAELKELDVFKNYDKGEENSKLYLKNLSKNIDEINLKFIYGRYVDWSNETNRNEFKIELFKKGRMKGQAFITLPTKELAIKALNETIGYLLDTKPIVVQFAKQKSHDKKD